MDERARDSSWAREPPRKPPPGFLADAKLRTPILGRGVW